MILEGRAGHSACSPDPLAGRPRSGPPKEWSIAIYRGASLDDLQPEAAPALTADGFAADPFLFDGHLFFEIKSNKGEIAAAEFPSLRGLGVVLAEPFHLSYPHVFRAGGEIFMTPESIEARAVRLYRAVDFPRRWDLDRVILDGVYADPTPFQHDGRWWLFACPRPFRHDVLSLFWADDVRGPWREHPRSPIIEGDPRRSRPAGRVQTIGGQLIRFAQDCHPAYGSGVRAFAINTLTTAVYEERELSSEPLLRASGRGWNRDGMHHIDLQRAGGGWVACVDGYTIVPETPPSISMNDAVDAEWEAMLEVTTARRVFGSPAWFRAACRADAALTPHVVVARRRGRVTGILPLVIRPDGTRAFATAMSDVNDAVAFDPETARHLVRAAGRPLDLRCLREDGVLLRALREMPEVTIEPDIDCYVADIDQGYFATRSRNFRKVLARHERRAAGLAVVELPSIDAEVFLALHRARFADRSHLNADFVRDVLPLFRVFAIVRGNEILAADLVAENGVWNGGFLPEVAEHSPGRLLFAAEIRAAIAAGYKRFDFLRGTHAYKAGWATRTERLWSAMSSR
ncbi:MAG TPA: GNAT family N-acetyltransferase, partial [Thermoanaerobaculia bacterium]|nr:GNAT family N-acetyltransferase [Thermoanaerobaculia bacterium]